MSTRPTGAHPSPEEVDALLDPTGGDPSVAEHVSGCPTCASVRAALEEVRSLLRAEALRVPEPPADLGPRIATALAGAALSEGTAFPDGEAAAASVSADVVPLDSRRRSMPRWLAVAAGVAVIGGVGLATAQLVGNDLSGADSMTAGAARDEDSSAEEAAPNAPSPMAGGGLQAVATDTDYDPVTLGDQVHNLVADVQSGEARVASGDTPVEVEGQLDATDDGAAGLGALNSETGIADCLAAIGAGGQLPLAVDLATYQGDPAAVVVLPSSGGGLDVWVVSRSCGSGDDGLRQFTHLDP